MDFLVLIENYGGIGLFVAIIIFTLTPIYKNMIRVIIDKINSKQPSIDLKYHTIFSDILYKRDIIIPSQTIHEDPRRDKVYKQILIALIDSYREELLRFIKKDITTYEVWRKEVSEMFMNVRKSFQSRMRNTVSDEVLKKLTAWDIENSQIMEQSVQNILSSTIYQDSRTRNLTLLSILEITFNVMIAESEKNLQYINGELTF